MSQNRKFKFKGKQVLLLGLVALVITAGYYRWTVETEKYQSLPASGEALPVHAEQEGEKEGGKPEENKEQKTGKEDKEKGEGQNKQNSEPGQGLGIAQLKQERDSARSEAMEQWKKTVQSQEASRETKEAAEKKVKAANEYAEKEKAVETLVKAKGFADCFAHISESGVSVMVSGGEINGAKVAQIKDIIVAETQAEVRNIKISAQ